VSRAVLPARYEVCLVTLRAWTSSAKNPAEGARQFAVERRQWRLTDAEGISAARHQSTCGLDAGYRQNPGAAFAEPDPSEASLLAISAKGHRVAIRQEGAFFARRQFNRRRAVEREFDQCPGFATVGPETVPLPITSPTLRLQPRRVAKRVSGYRQAAPRGAFGSPRLSSTRCSSPVSMSYR
jgi:hypothetical protein